MPPTDPLIIACAPNGARRSKADHPMIPLDAGEMAECARAVAQAGAAMLHMHVRGAEGRHSLDPGIYREWLAESRRAVGSDLVLQITTEAVGRYSPEEQMRCVKDVEPEAVSLALREIMPTDEDHAARAFFAWLAERQVLVQHILYTPDEVSRFTRLHRAGFFEGSKAFPLFVLGRYDVDARYDWRLLASFLERNEADHWMICAFGAGETAASAAAIAAGGHVRVGFENSCHRPDGSASADNAEAVARSADLASLLMRPLLSADRMRSTLAS